MRTERRSTSQKARVSLLALRGDKFSLQSPTHFYLIYMASGEQRIAVVFEVQTLLKSMWSCLRFKWQSYESQIVFFALSLTMIIVIEQNIVFSIEVYECRHLRLYLQSSTYRPSHVSPRNTAGVRQRSAFSCWPENGTLYHQCQCPSDPSIIPFLSDFFSINFIFRM